MSLDAEPPRRRDEGRRRGGHGAREPRNVHGDPGAGGQNHAPLAHQSQRNGRGGRAGKTPDNGRAPIDPDGAERPDEAGQIDVGRQGRRCRQTGVREGRIKVAAATMLTATATMPTRTALPAPAGQNVCAAMRARRRRQADGEPEQRLGRRRGVAAVNRPRSNSTRDGVRSRHRPRAAGTLTNIAMRRAKPRVVARPRRSPAEPGGPWTERGRGQRDPKMPSGNSITRSA